MLPVGVMIIALVYMFKKTTYGLSDQVSKLSRSYSSHLSVLVVLQSAGISTRTLAFYQAERSGIGKSLFRNTYLNMKMRTH
jgi:hypothetical protein